MKYIKTLLLKILVLIFILSLSNCASFPKNKINRTFLNTQNIKSLNGEFSIVAKEADSVSKKHWVYNNFFKEVNRDRLKDRLKDDLILSPLKTYSFRIGILSEKSIKISFIENNESIKELVCEYKLKNDGYLYLKNRNLKLVGIPYIMGRLDIKKMRITLDKKNNLITEVAEHNSGAGLLVMFLNWKNRNYTYSYMAL
ncbi:hypothetical protein [Aquimarina megaterium]|uniref:hypothetical protein n=1 Tax=Aquimarina megaterium TaxID=1443666 RepID=UPI00111280ED|nr:hypothetical protein [Aquimarina megaterium]